MVFSLLILLIGLCSVAAKPHCITAGGECQSSTTLCDGKVLVGKDTDGNRYCKKEDFCCIPKDDCPESEGFFKMPGPSKKCYKFNNSDKRSFTEAQEWCKNEGSNLRLAQISMANEVRSYIVQTYGGIWSEDYDTNPWTWVAAQGNDVMFQWLWSGVPITNNNPLFYTSTTSVDHFPDPVPSTTCLVMLTTYENSRSNPEEPYFFRDCSGQSYYTLCEKY